ncbi:MAG: hypothetical protein SFV54_07380 [Bryobacteraceae bacterium]|nr:hypothetical protein [Bryobacteraceae bacterium]
MPTLQEGRRPLEDTMPQSSGQPSRKACFAPTSVARKPYPQSFLTRFALEVNRQQTLDLDLISWPEELSANRAQRIAALKTLHYAGLPLLVGERRGGLHRLSGGRRVPQRDYNSKVGGWRVLFAIP